MNRFLIAMLIAWLVSACAPIQSPDAPATPLRDPPNPTRLQGRQPELCLAFSGGGIRAGSVALGVLQSLAEQDQLEHFDLIASVSGGGYPVAGVLQSLISKDASVKQILAEDGKFIAAIDANAEFITRFDAFINVAIAAVYSMPDKIFKNNTFFAAASGNYTYQLDIQETFMPAGIWPSGFSSKLYAATNMTFPFPIFVASSNTGGPPPAGHKYSAADLFEMTPEWVGSIGSGFYSDFPAKKRLTIGDAVSVSGAAVDTPGGIDHDEVIPEFFRKLGIALGGNIWLPRLGWVYVADGGFIENQAVLPLAQRGCRTILALDASEDEHAAFGGWDKLRHWLEIEGIEAGALSRLIPIGLEDWVPTKKFDGWTLPSHLWAANIRVGEYESDLLIMKLGIAPTDRERYPDPVRQFDEIALTSEDFKAGGGCNGKSLLEKRCAFPLQATAQQSYSPAEFRAYRHLGQFLGRRAQCVLFANGRGGDQATETSRLSADRWQNATCPSGK